MNDIIRKIADKNTKNTGDYLDSEGFLVCCKCHTRKECEHEFPLHSGKKRKFPIMCRCDREEELRYKQNQAQIIQQKRLEKLYSKGLTDQAYRKNTFSLDDGRNKEVTKLCMQYVKNWEKLKEQNCGIIFYGDTGGGKSFYSCCIANALIHKGVSVLVSRLSDLVKNRVDDRESGFSVKNFELIVLDDIGAENYTQTAYNIIDDIYRSNIPLIVTTNLSPSMMKRPSTIEQKRIFDRVIERCCITQKVDVYKSRLELAHKKREQAMRILRM